MLIRRKGSSFDMATLLCSYLIGSGFAACVVHGYATREFTKNDQQRVECPFLPNVVQVIVLFLAHFAAVVKHTHTSAVGILNKLARVFILSRICYSLILIITILIMICVYLPSSKKDARRET